MIESIEEKQLANELNKAGQKQKLWDISACE